jgi:hypothetical protein
MPAAAARGVLSGKVFEYLAAERPILAAVPPDGAGSRADSRDGSRRRRRSLTMSMRLRDALVELHRRFTNGGLADVQLTPVVARVRRPLDEGGGDRPSS